MKKLRLIKNEPETQLCHNTQDEEQDELISEYYRIIPLKFAEGTIATLGAAINNYLPWLKDQGLYLWDVAPDTYDDFVIHLQKNISKQTIKNYNCALSNLYDWMVSRKKSNIYERYGVDIKNPIDYFNTPKLTSDDDVIPELPDDEVVNYYFQKLKHEIKTARDSQNKRKLLIYSRQLVFDQIMFRAGLRVMEVSNLNTGDIYLEDMKIFVREGKNYKDRIVDITDTLGKLLKWYIEQIYPLYGPSMNANKSKNQPLFLSEQKKRLSKKTAQYHMWKNQIFFNIQIDKRFSPHGLRRLYATNLYKELFAEKYSDPIFYIRSQLGHAYISTTIRYVRIPQEFLNNRREKAMQNAHNLLLENLDNV